MKQDIKYIALQRKGFSLLDVLLGLGIMALVFANMAQQQNDLTNSTNAQAMAGDMLALKSAAKTYITSNAKTLSKMGNSTIEIPIVGNSNWNGIGDLQSTGLLPENYSPNLPMGQKAHLLIRNVPQNGNIPQHIDAMLVASGGNPMNDRQVGLAMSKIGGDGGGVMKTPPPGVSSSNIQGSYASWSSPISTWSSTVPITYGHIAINLNSSLSPVAEWLNRYDTGNPEANRMHTNIDMNNNSLNNTNSINGVGDKSPLYIQTGSHLGKIISSTGLSLCNADYVGCGIQVSNDGGFYDMQDTWITFTGSYTGSGLRVASANNVNGEREEDSGRTNNGNNLWVQGQTASEGGIQTSTSKGISWSDNPSINGAIAASATYDGSYINFTGGDNKFQGIFANIMKTTKVLDANNNNYYLVPSNKSILKDVKTSKLSAGGYDIDQGVPAGWTGGINTFDIVTHGTGAFGVDDDGNVNIMIGTYGPGIHRGNIIASEDIKGQIFMPNYVAVDGDACNININGFMGSQNSFSIEDGAIAKDYEGRLISCVQGYWKLPRVYYKGILFQNKWTKQKGNFTAYTNNSGYAVLVVINSMFNGGSKDEPHWIANLLNVNYNGGQTNMQVCNVAAHMANDNMGGNLSCTIIVPENSTLQVLPVGSQTNDFIVTGFQ